MLLPALLNALLALLATFKAARAQGPVLNVPRVSSQSQARRNAASALWVRTRLKARAVVPAALQDTFKQALGRALVRPAVLGYSVRQRASRPQLSAPREAFVWSVPVGAVCATRGRIRPPRRMRVQFVLRAYIRHQWALQVAQIVQLAIHSHPPGKAHVQFAMRAFTRT